jgi:hypothetical protein
MACVTLTRITLPRVFGALPGPGWEVAYEGQLIATYAEEPNGWLRQIGSSQLDARLEASLGRQAGKWDSAKAYPNLDDLREAYVLRAKVWEGRQAGKGAPGFSDREG